MIIHSHKYSNLQRNYLLISGNSRHSGGFSSLLRRRLESDADRCCGGDRRHSGGFLLRIMPPSWHPAPACTPRLRCKRAILLCSNDGAASIPKSGLEIKNRCSLWAVLEGFFASIRKFGLEIKNRCTQEGLNREKLASIRKSGLKIKNRCTQEGLNREKLASIRKSEPEIKNRCTQEGLNGEKLTSIRKSGLEIKNRCTQEGLNGEILASIRKSGPEIKNRCALALRRRSAGGTILLRGNEKQNRTRKIAVATPTAGETFLCCSTVN